MMTHAARQKLGMLYEARANQIRTRYAPLVTQLTGTSLLYLYVVVFQLILQMHSHSQIATTSEKYARAK